MGGEVKASPPFVLYMAKKSPQPVQEADDWKAADDHRTLMSAAEVRSDPKRMAGVKRHHAKTRVALSRVGRALGGRR